MVRRKSNFSLGVPGVRVELQTWTPAKGETGSLTPCPKADLISTEHMYPTCSATGTDTLISLQWFFSSPFPSVSKAGEWISSASKSQNLSVPGIFSHHRQQQASWPTNKSLHYPTWPQSFTPGQPQNTGNRGNSPTPLRRNTALHYLQDH